MKKIYFDNNATTPLDPRCLKVMLQELEGLPSNPSSVHSFGREAKRRLIEARETVASFFGADPSEIIFTSGGTESLNLLYRGMGVKGHAITSCIEHAATEETLAQLTSQGLKCTPVSVGTWGAPLPEQIQEAIRPDTRFIALSLANGETGVKIDLEPIANIAQKEGIPLFLDGVSFLGKEPLSLLHPGISAIAFSSHKLHGPKGVGGLYVRSSLKLTAQITGGGQESKLRSGTENLASILGMAEAFSLLQKGQKEMTEHMHLLRQRLETALFEQIPDLLIHGQGPRLSNTSNIAFLGVDGETLLMQLDLASIAVSHGSACSSGSIEPSKVLTRMGIGHKIARSSLRFSLSRMNTLQEVDRCVDVTTELVKKLRSFTLEPSGRSQF